MMKGLQQTPYVDTGRGREQTVQGEQEGAQGIMFPVPCWEIDATLI